MRLLAISSAVAAVVAIGACGPDGTVPTDQSNSSAALPALAKVAKSPKEDRHFGTRLSGAFEVPVRDTRGRGKLKLELSKDGQELKYELEVNHINNVVASHIHLGPVGVNGGIVVFLYGPAAPGGGPAHGMLAKGTITAANLIGALLHQPLSALIANIEAGNAYANVHTNDGVGATNTGPGDFPGGEIRGQVHTHGHTP
jgi:hypothetical protein